MAKNPFLGFYFCFEEENPKAKKKGNKSD